MRRLNVTSTFEKVPAGAKPPSAKATVELQWLEHLWNHGNMFETGVLKVIKANDRETMYIELGTK